MENTGDRLNKLLAMGLAWLAALRHAITVRAEKLARWTPVQRLRTATGGTRGDVPGWVLITLMSAILVAGLLAIAGPALERLFNQAMDQVQPAGG